MSLAPTRLPWPVRLRWWAFTTLVRANALRSRPRPPQRRRSTALRRVPEDALWIFVSTIGELHAIDTLLQRLVSALPHWRLVLITDRPQYVETFQRHHPDAVVHVTDSGGLDVRPLARALPPQLLVVAEIPCLPSDAPCRFPVAYLLETKRRRRPAVLVNGWLYGDGPASRIDRVERRCFTAAYAKLFDLQCVQLDTVRTQLVACGADPRRVRVSGNLKFDAQVEHAPADAAFEGLLGTRRDPNRPVVVAGSVTDHHELTLVIDAFLRLQARQPGARLVLAPRHPENPHVRADIATLLDASGLPHAWRTQCQAAMPAEARVLVLDTFGELRSAYAQALVAHVGVNHNVLEPLQCGVGVTVRSDWNPRFPSYPVYRQLHDRGVIQQCDDADALAAAWQRIVRQGPDTAAAQAVLSDLRGSTRRHLAAIGEVLPGLSVAAACTAME